MGTRGFVGVHIDGVTTLSYNQDDSYPTCLGQETVSWLDKALANNSLDAVKDSVRSIRWVEENAEPTVEERVQYLHLFQSVSSGQDWYSLLRDIQGNFSGMIAEGIATKASPQWPADSLFCEWGYVMDFDAEIFEVYGGFQTKPHRHGRFALLEPRETYYPVRLVASYPFSNLPAMSLLHDLEGTNV